MPEVDVRVAARSLKAVLFSWLVASLAGPLTLFVAVVGQGVGACLGGCTWIGVSLPADRQVWALVNQPVVNFASTAAAIPYWLGSLILPLLLAAVLIPFVPRARSVAGELVMVQLSWMLAVVGGAWLPLLDPAQGHLVPLLGFRMLPGGLVWLAPITAGVTVLLPTLRLIALARVASGDISRLGRMGLVVTHLAPPVVAWGALVSVLRGAPPLAACAAALLLLALALVIAWVGYPPPFVQTLVPLRAASFAWAGVVLAALIGLWWFTGRALPGDQRAGILWGHRDARNNVRAWIAPTQLGE